MNARSTESARRSHAAAKWGGMAFAVRAVCVGLAGYLVGLPAAADQATTTAGGGNPNARVSASADLDFILNIGKFLFFRVGTGAFPTPGATVDTVSFTVAPVIPGAGITPSGSGNNVAVDWNGAAPGASVTGANTTLPVEVRCNGGQVSIRAAVVTPLASGANTIPLSQILVSSSDANLPAPLVPDAGTGPAVNVTATSFGNLVTVRNANWTFTYSPVSLPIAGDYTGQINFTASTP